MLQPIYSIFALTMRLSIYQNISLRKTFGVLSLLVLLITGATAAEPVVRTVPWVAADATIPHDTYAFKNITLKGTSSIQGQNVRATWDFGDGSTPVSFRVDNGYDVSARHAYHGEAGIAFTARLTVVDTATGESSSASYLVALREKNLQAEANIAIDEGLWYLHKSMNRIALGGLEAGAWQGNCGAACDAVGEADAWNVLAFERQGHLESGDSSNPYTETVSRAMKTLLRQAKSGSVRSEAWTAAIAAAASPNAIADSATGRTYRQVLQDASGTSAKLATAWPEAGLENAASASLSTEGLYRLAQAMRAGSGGDATPGLDWYAAETANGAPLNGVARMLVNRQEEGGFWTGYSDTPKTASLQTAQALLTLSATPIRAAGANSVFNVTPQVSMTVTAFGFARSTNTFNGTLTLTNTSAQPITGPVTVGIFNITAGVTLANGNGTFNGSPYVNITPSSLAPGQSASVLLKFSNPSFAVITFSRAAYSGVFPPAALSLGCPANSGTINSPYTSALSANGGAQAYTYSIGPGSLPSNLNLNPATGDITGTPDTLGLVNFTANVTDSAGGTAQTISTSCSINITTGNTAPTANAQTTSTNEDIALPITLTGSDPESSSLTFSIVLGPSNGSLSVITPINATSASVTYTPGLNYNGSDSFTFKVNDGSLDSSAATVSITVNPVNDAPSFTKGPDQSVNENAGAQTVVGWATAISPGPANESGQTVVFNITGNTNGGLFSVAPAIAPNGTLTFTPAPNASGAATISVTLSDNGGTANGGVNVSGTQTFDIGVNGVNSVPSFTKGADQTVLEDAGAQSVPGWATAISQGVGDAGQTLTFNITGNTNAALFSAGPAVAANGTLTFTPAANANGTATITLTLQDNGGTANGGVDTSAAQSFVINVTAVNDAPSFTNAGNQTVLEDSGAQTVVNFATAISAGPADESGQTLIFNVTGNTNAALFSVAPSVAANGTLTYTPAADTSGTSSITLTLSDNGGTANGGVNTSAGQVFSITVTSVNDAPSFTKGADQTVLEDSGAATVVGWATAINQGAGDTGQTLTFNVTGNTNAALFSAGPAIAANGTLTFTPAANANGAATITINLKDNGGTANGGVDTSASQSFVINVTAVNDAPSFTKGADQTVLEDSGAQSVPGWATAIVAGPADESGQTLTFNITGNTNAGLFSAAPAVASNGTLTYTPTANASGVATITLTLGDNGGTANGGVAVSASQSFTITVTAVNDAPSFTKGANQTVNEDAGAQTVVGWATAISAGVNETQNVSFVIVSNDNAGMFSAGPAVAANGTLTYTPGANKNGVANITIKIQDDGGTANGGIDQSATQSFTITVNAVNDKPVMTVAKTLTVQANMKIVGAGGLLTGASDPGDPENLSPVFTVGAVGGTAAASVSNLNAATGTFDFDPPAGASGATSFTYTVCDNGVPAPSVCSDPITVNVTINGPVIWFVNSAAAAGGTGRLSAPFQTIAQADAVDGANHRIFLFSGTYANGILLASGEWLIGQGVTGSASFDALMGITPPAGTIARPAVATGSVTVQSTVNVNTNTVVRAIALSTGSATGLNGGGTLTGVTVDQSSITTTTGTALSLSGVGGSFTFTSISSNGAPLGINLINTTGSVTVTGTGAVNTGGLIQNSAVDGIKMFGAQNISFTDLRVLNSFDNNLDARAVNGLTISRSTFDTTTGALPGVPVGDERHNFYGSLITNLIVQNGTIFDGGATNVANVHNIKIDSLLGVSAFRNSIIRDGKDMNLLITNTTATAYSGTADSITIEDNMRLQTPSPGGVAGDNAQIRAHAGANMLVTVQGGINGVSQFTGSQQNCIQLVAEGLVTGGKMTASISQATMTGANGPAVNLATNNLGFMRATVTGLTLSSALSSPINMVNFETSTLIATISNNIITVPNTAGNGITAEIENNGTMTASITGNTISGAATFGIHGQAKTNGSVLNLTVANNTVTLTDAISLDAITVESGSSAGASTSAVCLNMLNNTASSTTAAQQGYRLIVRASTTFQLQNFVGVGTSATDVTTWVNTTKSNTGPVQVSFTAPGAYSTVGSCPVP